MSKKTEDINWDDDFNFDFEEDKTGGFQSGKLKAGRRAVVEFSGSFLSAVKKSLLDPANQRRILDKNAPTGATAVFDAASQGKRAVKEIYSETKEEFLKSLGDVSDDVKTLTSVYGQKAPPRFVQRIEELAERTAKRTYASPEESEKEELDGGLDAIMRSVAKGQYNSTIVNKKTTNEQTGKLIVSQATTTVAVQTGNKILSNISKNSDILISLNTAQAKLQRKHIELAYNQTVIMRQQLDVLQQTQSLHQKAYEALIKNTGLPEHIKSTLWEETNRSFKTRLVGIATERATARFGDVFGRITKQMKENMAGKADMLGGNISSALSAGATYAELRQMMGGGSGAQMAGGAAGQLAMMYLQHKLSSKIGDRFKKDPRTKVYGDNIQNFMNSAPGLFNKLQDNYGAFRQLTDLLGIGDIMANDSSLNVRVRGNGIKDLDAHQAFNRKSQLALTEVIPGWLSKMHHRLSQIATGDKNVEEQTYDWERGNFTNMRDVKQRTLDSMFNKNQLKDSRKKAMDILKVLDPNKELQPRDRQILTKYIFQQANSDVGYIDPADLMNLARSPILDIDPDAAERIADTLAGTFGTTVGTKFKSGIFDNNNKNVKYQERMLNANNALKELRTSLPNGMRATIEQANVGNMEMLKELGYVSWDKDAKEWRFDQSKYLDQLLPGKRGPSLGPNLPGGGGGGPGGPAGGMPRPSSTTTYHPFGSGGRGGTPGMPPTPNIGGDGYTDFQRDLLEAIEANSAKSSVDISNQVLEAIRLRLDLGIPTGGASESPQEIQKKSTWFRKLLGAGSRLKGTKSFLSKAMHAQLKLAGLPFKMFTGSIQAGASVGRSLFRTITGSKAAKMVSSTSSKFAKSFGDVYVTGKEKAVMTMAGIRAGEYFDAASGKVIKTLKDIKGAVLDAAGNEIISESEFLAGLYTMVNGKRKSIIGGILKSAGSLLSGAVKLNTLPFKIAGGAFNLARRLLKTRTDIFVKGETSPRLLYSILHAGGYFNADGSVIRSIKDIKGAVFDSAGEEVLKVADIARGLVDRSGKPIMGMGSGILGALLKMPFKVAGAVGKGAFGLAKLNIAALKLPFKIGSKIASLFKGGKASPELQVSAHTADTVDAIYGLLDERLARPKGSWKDRDGSGFRDGSREDYLRRTKKQAEEIKKPEDKASGERRGILGMLMAMVGGIGTVIGTMRSWFGNIFGLMRIAAQTKMATSAFDAIGALAGRGRRGRRGRGAAGAGAASAGILSKMKAFGKSGMGKALGIGALVGGGMLWSGNAFASSAAKGASDALGMSDSKAFSANDMGLMGGGSGGSGGSSSDTIGFGGDGKLSVMDRIGNGIGGSVLGEIGAIASFPLMAMAYQKLQGTKLGGRILPQFQHATPGAAPTTKMGKAKQFMLGTTKGRLLLAALTGAGVVGAKHAVLGTGGETMEGEAKTSYLTTLLAELGMATALPAGLAAYSGWKNRRRISQLNGTVGPHRPASGGSLSRLSFTPTGAPARPGLGVNTPGLNAAIARSNIQGPLPQPPVARPGMMARAGQMAGNFGKGVFRNAGPLGLGFAAYDGLTTEGSTWDKTKAFGSSLLQTAAIGKGIDIGGKLLTKGGRAGLAQGARSLMSAGGRVIAGGAGRAMLGTAGRLIAGQALRSGLMAGGAAVVGFLGAPVVLTGLAVAAVGAGLYFGYKKFFGTDKAAVMRYRMAQYGVDVDTKDHVTRVGQLETLAKKYVKISGASGTFSSGFPYKEALAIFGVPQGDVEHTQRFSAWFTQRFKPVFIKGMAAYQTLTKSKDLEKADGLDKETKLKYVKDIGGLDATAYSTLVLPFTSDKESKYTAKKVSKEFDRALEKIGHEKGKGEKSLTDKAKDTISKGWDKAKSLGRAGWEVYKDAVMMVGEHAVGVAKDVWGAVTKPVETAKSAWQNVKQTAGKVGGFVGRAVTAVGDGVSNFVASMSGSQKQWQMMVYKAFKSAGFSEQQARILTAEIGRENAYNPKYLFGGHADPHKGTNLGMLSWQGDRKPKLIAFLAAAKVIDKNGNIAQNQAGLNAQASFIMWELRNTHKKVGEKFLATPNISYAEGAYLIGKHYILWRIDDPKYKASGIKNRDGFYNMLLKQLGTSDGQGLGASGGAARSTSPPGIQRAAGAIMGAAQVGAAATMGGTIGRGPVGNGVLQRQYQNTGAGSSAGVVVSPTPITGISPNHKAYKAAMYATKHARSSSDGACAKYVRVALMTGGGYPLKGWPVSAGDYAAQGTLKTIGFVQINIKSQPQIGDVMVWSKVPAHPHGHIQIYNGKNWVSDFVQQNSMPWGKGAQGSVSTLWRDGTLLGKQVTGSVDAKSTPSNTPAPEAKADPKPAQKTAASNAPKATIADTSGPVVHAAPVAAKTTPRPQQPVSTSADTAMATSNQNRAKQQHVATEAQEGILREQLQVQKSMLKTLSEIRDRLPPVGGTPNQTTQTRMQAAQQQLGKTAVQPINMDIQL